MAHYDEFYEDVFTVARKRQEELEANCKHQWLMHEVTIDGEPVSVTCMHCDKIHRIDNKTGGM